MLTPLVLISLRKKKNTFNIWPLQEVVNIYGVIVHLYLFSNFTLLSRASNKGRRQQKQALSLPVSTFLPNTAFQYSNIRPTVAATDRQLRMTSSFFFSVFFLSCFKDKKQNKTTSCDKIKLDQMTGALFRHTVDKRPMPF